MKVFHLLNPSRRRAPEVRALTEANHLSAPWARVSREHPDHTETLVQWSLNEGVQRLVVWGGDGTLSRVVRALWRRKALDKMELALVPAGTCNDLARRMGLRFEEWTSWQAAEPDGRKASMSLAVLEFDLPKAAGASGPGGPARVPPGEASARFQSVRLPFINNAGFGRPKTSFDRKDGPLRTLMSFQRVPAAVRWDAGELRGVYYMGLFCLGPYFSGGLHFEPEASPERGEVRTFLVPARSRPRLAARLLAGRFGFPLADSKITAFSAPSLSVEAERPVWPQADGEPPADQGVASFKISVQPEKWTLWVPS